MYLEPPLDASEAAGRDREPALAEQLGHFVRAARSAFSSNTERAVRSDLCIYAEWCTEHGRRALPAKPETVAAFVDAMAEIRNPRDLLHDYRRLCRLTNSVHAPPSAQTV